MNTQSLAFVLVSILATVIPVSLILWIIASSATSSPSSFLSDGSSDVQSPLRWFVAIFLPIVLAINSLAKKSLDMSGALAALTLGCLVTLSSYSFILCLLVFFYSGTKLTKVKSNLKKKFEEGYSPSGKRTWINVVCNGAVPGLMSLLYIMERGSGGEIAINFTQDYNSSWFAMAVMGGIACCCGDTWASEIGSAYSSNDPVLIFSFRRVPRGTNGGVSAVGLVMSFLGGFVIGIAFYLSVLLWVPRDVLFLSPPQVPVVFVGGAAGFLGSLIDSFLGANFQFSGEDVVTKKIVEVPGERVRWISGVALLDNHSVNLISSLLTALMTPRLSQWIWSYFEPLSVPYS